MVNPLLVLIVGIFVGFYIGMTLYPKIGKYWNK